MDNTGGTWALTAATGSYQLLGDEIQYGEIIGGAITAAGGAKLQVRPAPGVSDGSTTAASPAWRSGRGCSTSPATAASCGRGGHHPGGRGHHHPGRQRHRPGVLPDPAGGRGDVRPVRGRSALPAFDNNILTLGPTTDRPQDRDRGRPTCSAAGCSCTVRDGAAMVNRGLVHVQQGTLRATGARRSRSPTAARCRWTPGRPGRGRWRPTAGPSRAAGRWPGSLTFTGTGNDLRPGSSPGTLTVDRQRHPERRHDAVRRAERDRRRDRARPGLPSPGR